MAAITINEIGAAYHLAKRRFAGDISEGEAIRGLIEEQRMNRSSANDYLDAFRHMRNGEVYKRTINATATRYYLGQIREDFGVEGGALALQSLREHIAYYELTSGVRCIALRQVVTDFGSEEPASDTDARVALQNELDAAVAVSLAMPPIARLGLLPEKGTKPASAVVETKVYLRNPHVIAEVLLRAEGMCERCSKPAPFKRKGDQSPYLEVHHRQRLADGGDDTVENAEALCPNCHREKHYGTC